MENKIGNPGSRKYRTRNREPSSPRRIRPRLRIHVHGVTPSITFAADEAVSQFLKLLFWSVRIPNGALRMAADHGQFAFRSPHQHMQIGGLRRDACGKATRGKSPAVVEALGIGFDYKREEAFAQSG